MSAPDATPSLDSETDWQYRRTALETQRDMAKKVRAYDRVRQIDGEIVAVDAIIDLEARVAALEVWRAPFGTRRFTGDSSATTFIVNNGTGDGMRDLPLRPAPEPPSDEAAAREAAKNALSAATRVAAPVYEHPPRPVAPVTDDELMAAMGKGIHYENGKLVGYDLIESLAALKKLLNRAAPEARVVGACVVRGKDVADSAVLFGIQPSKEALCLDMARLYGGTAHQLLLGPQIATEGGR